MGKLSNLLKNQTVRVYSTHKNRTKSEVRGWVNDCCILPFEDPSEGYILIQTSKGQIQKIPFSGEDSVITKIHSKYELSARTLYKNLSGLNWDAFQNPKERLEFATRGKLREFDETESWNQCSKFISLRTIGKKLLTEKSQYQSFLPGIGVYLQNNL